MSRKIQNLIFSLYDILIIKYQIFISTIMSKLSLKFQGCKFGKFFKTSGTCFYKAYKSKSIIIGCNVSINSSHRTNRVGLTNPSSLETLQDGKIIIGDDTGLSSVVLSSRSEINIGNRVKIGANTRILDHDFHSLDKEKRKTSDDKKYIKSEPITIEDDVFIGTNSIILKGVNIGAGTIIGAGSIVTLKNIPSGVIVSGNPAKIIKKINNE